ncbi:MAG: hypothetical protein R2695_15435 [Acidimicrobiales bacterium]
MSGTDELYNTASRSPMSTSRWMLRPTWRSASRWTRRPTLVVQVTAWRLVVDQDRQPFVQVTGPLVQHPIVVPGSELAPR